MSPFCTAWSWEHFLIQKQTKKQFHPVWITQQADKVYAQDISNAGVAHISFVEKEKKPRLFISQKMYQDSHGEIRIFLSFFTLIFWLSIILIWVPIRSGRAWGPIHYMGSPKSFMGPLVIYKISFLTPSSHICKPDTLGNLSEENIILTLEMDFQFSPSAPPSSIWTGTHRHILTVSWKSQWGQRSGSWWIVCSWTYLLGSCHCAHF